MVINHFNVPATFMFKRLILQKKFLAILCCFYWLPALSQKAQLPAVQAAFSRYQQSHFQEKVFVHTDKSFYLAGELVWFKVYCVDANENKPLDMSKVAYIEIIDRANKPVMQAKIALQNGSGHGSFLLPASVNSGNYSFRAYTAWMKNFNADFYFTKPVTIINTLKAGSVPEWNDTTSFTARFFPEGGNLVEGLESRVGFEVKDKFGKGLSYSGFIINERNDTITRFIPLKFGIGQFTFTPQAGERYKAIISTTNGRKITTDLVTANSTGYVMQVTDNGESGLKVTVKTNIAAINASEVFLLVNTRQKVGLATQGILQNGTTSFTVDKFSLGEGISQLTVFNQQGQPVCERLVFKKPAHRLLLNLKSDLQQYATRKKVNVTVALNEKAGPADLSVSVFKLDSLSATDGNDIANYLWLSSDLNGFIESPDYYFTSNEPEVAAATDNLMLTHGWRRFQWNEVLKNAVPAFRFMPENIGHIIYGKIMHTVSGAPASATGAYLSIPGTRTQFYSTKSNTEGILAFQVKPFYGPNELIVQAKAGKDSSFKMELANPFSNQYTSVSLPYLQFSTAWQQSLARQSINTQVQHSFAAKGLNQFALPEMDSLPFYGKPTSQYLLDNYVRFTTMEEVLREYITEVVVRKRGNNYQFPVTKPKISGVYEGDPLVMLDGVPVFDNNKIMSYDPLKVRKLEVVANRYFYGPSVFDGIINFTTYNGVLEGFQLDPAAIVIDYEGLQLQRQFYSPVYDTPEQVQSRMPDFRSLLYFSPDIKTDASGKTQFHFYTSDVAGKYMVVLQGLTENGTSGSQSVVFDVK